MGATAGVTIGYDWQYTYLSPAQKAATIISWDDYTTQFGDANYRLHEQLFDRASDCRGEHGLRGV